MGRSRRTSILAAGGIIVRRNSRAVIAIVQRKRDNAWVLPKGKIKSNEKPIAAAKREAMEETGSAVSVYEFLGVISYPSGDTPKIAHFWRMQAKGKADTLTDDIKSKFRRTRSSAHQFRSEFKGRPLGSNLRLL